MRALGHWVTVARRALNPAVQVRVLLPQYAAIVELERRLVANEEIAGAEPAGRSLTR